MGALYLDTSALVKWYVRERGSDWFAALVNPRLAHHLYVVRIAGPELVAAVARKMRMHELPQDAGRKVIEAFRFDWTQRYLIVEVTSGVANLAMDLAGRHGLRGYDAVHLAAALSLATHRRLLGLDPLRLISADVEQLNAALVEGLLGENPNDHP